MAESLNDAGYEVLEAEDGVLALSFLDNPSRPFSILVTDFHKPGDIDGLQVAKRTRSAKPAVPVVVVTGRPDALRYSWDKDLGYKLLAKPYRPSELVRLVRTLIGTPRH